MSEIKGQILGIIIVLMIFGVVSGAMIALFNNLSQTVTDNVNELITSESSSEYLSIS